MNENYFYDLGNFLNDEIFMNPLLNPYFFLFDYPKGNNKESKESYENTSKYKQQQMNFILDEYLKKPEFFKDINSRNQNKLMTNINNLSILVKSENSFIINKTKDTSNDQFLLKKRFYDIFTDLFNRDLLNEQKHIFMFQFITIISCSNLISSYRNRYSIKDNDLFFFYKGGTVMKLLIDKYKDFIPVSENDNINKYYKRSDSDYEIYINPKIKEYNFHYFNINILIYNILLKLNNYFNKNYKQLFNMTLITKDKMKEIVKNGNEILELNKRDQSDDNIYTKIDSIVGVQILDKLYYNIDNDEKFINNNNINNCGKKHQIVYSDFNKVLYNNIDDLEYINEHKQRMNFIHKIKDFNQNNCKILNIKRNNFYINQEENNILYNPINSTNKNYFFHYMNETNHFQQNDLKSSFDLHRIKVSCCLIFKTINGDLGIMLTPSEIIDISIPNKNDYKVNLNKQKSITQYNYNNSNIGELKFNSYSLIGFINDLMKILYLETNYIPWKETKYQKRIYRLILFIILYLYSQNKPKDEFDTNINSIKRYFTIQNTQKNNKVPEFDTLYDYTQKTLLQNKEQTKEQTKLNEYIQYINTTFTNLIKTEIKKKFSNVNDLDKLKKYLKYKKKYFILKNKYLILKNKLNNK